MKLKEQVFLTAMQLRLKFLGLVQPAKATDEALRLFFTPRFGKLREKDIRFLETADAKEGMETKRGFLQTYSWKGSGETVLLMHGWHENAARWRYFIPMLLKQGFQVIAVDAPAHGNSGGSILNVPIYAEQIVKLVEVYNPHHLVGHSIGGAAIVLYLGMMRGVDRIKRIVLQAIPVEVDSVVEDFVKLLKVSPKLEEKMKRRFQETYGFSFSEYQASKLLANSQVEILFMHDEEDKTASFKKVKETNETLNHARLYATKGYGHGLKKEEIDQTACKFLAFGTKAID